MSEISQEAERAAIDVFHAETGSAKVLVLEKALKAAMAVERPAIQAQVLAGVRERLLDDDGPVLLELREALAEEADGRDWQDVEGDWLLPGNPEVDAAAEDISKRVKAKLLATLNPSDLGQADANPKLGEEG